MLITIIILIAGIAGGFVNYFAAKGQLFDKKGKPKKNGWVFLICILAVVLLAIAQKFGQDYLDKQKEAANQISEKKHDSTLQANYDTSLIANTLKIKSNFDSGNDVQTAILSKTLGEYNLALDSANNRIVRLVKDSSKTRVIEPENPTLFVDSITLMKKFDDNFQFNVSYVSLDATSESYKISSSVLLADYNFTNLRFVGTNSPFSFSEQIGKDLIMKKIFVVRSNSQFSYVILWINGTYKNHDESKTFPINMVYYYGYPSATNGQISGQTKEKIIALVESQTKK